MAHLFQRLLDLLPTEIALIAVFFVRRTVRGWVAAMAGVQPGRFAVGLVFVIGAGSGVAAPVVMISVDGMKPEYVLEAQQKGLKIPFLRRLAVEGTYAEGVIGVWPTVTCLRRWPQILPMASPALFPAKGSDRWEGFPMRLI